MSAHTTTCPSTCSTPRVCEAIRADRARLSKLGYLPHTAAGLPKRMTPSVASTPDPSAPVPMGPVAPRPDGLTGALLGALSDLSDLPSEPACRACKVAREMGDATCPACHTPTNVWASVGKRD